MVLLVQINNYQTILIMNKKSTDPKFAIICGSTCPEIAAEIAKILGKELVRCKITKFANGEPDVLIEESVRGKTVFVIQTSLLDEAGDNLLETVAIADALKRAHCYETFLVQLMYPMARQDRREQDKKTGKPKRRPISASIAARMFQDVAGFRGLITMHLHAGQIEGFFDPNKCIVENISPSKIFIKHLKDEGIINGKKNVMLLAPDVGAASSVSLLSDILNFPPYGIIDKRRSGPGDPEVMNIIGEVKDMIVILWDDMVDSGGTAVKAAQKALNHGAKEVLLIATHPVLSGKAVVTLINSPFSKVIFSNTLPLPEALKNDQRFVQLSVAPMLADVIANVYNDQSLEDIVSANTEELSVSLQA